MSQHDVTQALSFDHPSKGRANARAVPKSRQVDARRSMTFAPGWARRPRQRDLLIEHLHLI